ncbi:MAG: PKD domain-containing protein, partial [Bacteroidales bacterium]|nr:PKD domain-containing protein [Bacteroidales bacterium]
FGDSTHFTDLTPTDYQTIQGWEWQFGDGVISHEQHPVHQYLAPGVYQVTLKILNTNFCTDSIIKDILVRELPIVNFSPDSSCFSSAISFIDETTYNGTPGSWLWDFGDGNTSTDQNPVYIYATDGTYQVSLMVTELGEGTPLGCSNTFTKAHYVNPLPIVDFTFDSVCLGTITQFTNLSSSPIGIESYFWDFADGSTSSTADPTHTYTTFGSFEVKLFVTDFMGCMDSIQKTVNVYEIPVVAFDASTVCLGDSTEFTDLTTPSGANWNWSFGDGTSATLNNPKHLYENEGTYSVLLEVATANGCSNSVVQDVEVLPLPIVNFSWNFAACAGDTVFFEDLSQGIGTDITNWNWNFGDGASATISDPTHIYPVSNDTIYYVTLVVETATGCVDSLTQAVNITGTPVADFSFTNNSEQGPCINNQFNFIDESTTQSGLIQDWLWNFGDGTTSGSQNPIHFYNTSGTFTVILTVNNTAGCDHTITQDIVVFDLPIVEFVFDSVCLGDTTHFNDSDQIELLATAEWSYIFGDGATTTISDPTHLYTTPGDYSVILQIIDTNLCSNQIQHQVPVYGLPAVDFTNDTACLGLSTQYTDLTTIADHDLVAWNWSFGDGATDIVQHPAHTFVDFGVFSTQLIVTDSWGCVDSLQKNVHVYETPTAHFNWSDTSCTSGLIHFADSSYHNQGHAITDFLWTINGFETAIQNPQYTFPLTEVTYPISLEITDIRGCTDQVIRNIYINPELQVSFIADTVCFGIETQLIAYPTKPDEADVAQWIWYFDDGSDELITTEDTIYHQFNGEGYFRVELQGIDDGNCASNSHKTIKIRRLPIADFTANPAACLDSTVFLEESVGSEGQIDQWNWNFGDGQSETINSPDNPDTKHLYPPYLMDYDASITVIDEYGCIDSISKVVKRYPCMFVNFYTEKNIHCQNKEVTFIDSSFVNRETIIVSRYWDFGHNHELTTGAESDTVTHIYENTGTYTVIYVLTFNEDGEIISDTARKTISIFPTPLVAMMTENICDGEKAFFVNNTNANNSIINNWTWTFGDGTDTTIISSDVNNTVYHQYPHSGAYDLQLMAVTDLGCSDTAFRNFIVNPMPQISFISDTNVLCGPGMILFTDSSVVETGSIVERNWDFGDGMGYIGLEDTVSHLFDLDISTPSTPSNEYFTISLTTTSDSACMATDS